jgi:insulysin
VPDSNNENSCLVSYYEYGRDEGTDGGKMNLLNKLVMQYLQEPTFDQLRTKEQLGYVVFSRPRNTRDIQSAWFLIQSPGKNCEHIRKRLDIHMSKMRQKVRDMTDDEFKTVVGAVMTDISEKDKNLLEAHNRVWGSELASHSYLFDRQERDIALLPTLTKAEF